MDFIIKFGEGRSPDIFSKIAEKAAEQIKTNSSQNKTTQLRKFYDELAMWNDRVQAKREQKEIEYQNLAAFIKMLKAKVAYAEGRKYVDENFSKIFNQCIDQIHSAETLREAKLFMEAVMGYCKLYETSKK
ncbi:CRISPR type III-A/MTUBE-associated protein Csm2 [Canicola haemoglobinophilus]|uniref:CRISPR system Cms protein Csm2 n=1 Tax=Canicola haemoglobinophilus TaxID=733 RepID=A0AB38H9K7_9PAST|nr:type III-A CRISPR-associated protein Csm2 [Canicola haemoglobinophilus]STO53530.1 CRISPR type III-A/MTUBE-associated protein Csm2 [Canicola haemoglobinophilus]STO68064.1 CRISPR type III-A/MTUBE-associated protein Csm2 [Canicola haemoglobinophilus]